MKYCNNCNSLALHNSCAYGFQFSHSHEIWNIEKDYCSKWKEIIKNNKRVKYICLKGENNGMD